MTLGPTVVCRTPWTSIGRDYRTSHEEWLTVTQSARGAGSSVGGRGPVGSALASPAAEQQQAADGEHDDAGGNRQVRGGTGERQTGDFAASSASSAGAADAPGAVGQRLAGELTTADSPATSGGIWVVGATTGVLSDTSTSVVTSMSQSTACAETIQVPS